MLKRPGAGKKRAIPGSVRKLAEQRSGKAKTGEEAEFRNLNEHSEPVFNAV
ncbi:hypothetical protein EDF83_0859 [Pseudomonas protegens]|nr:hypothetical protein EDF83_0859 [Pseudomonas protegens]ROQ83918.1 hypothetical protein EC837_0776 [Pseudomonas protegens]